MANGLNLRPWSALTLETSVVVVCPREQKAFRGVQHATSLSRISPHRLCKRRKSPSAKDEVGHRQSPHRLLKRKKKNPIPLQKDEDVSPVDSSIVQKKNPIPERWGCSRRRPAKQRECRFALCEILCARDARTRRTHALESISTPAIAIACKHTHTHTHTQKHPQKN